MQGDAQSRKEGQIRLVPLGYNSSTTSDQNIRTGTAYGELYNLMSYIKSDVYTGVIKQNHVRIPTPYSGEITQLYLTFRLRMGNDEPSTRTMWLGYSNPSKINTNKPIVMTEQTIKDTHREIFGDDTGLQAGAEEYIQFHRVNIMPIIRKAQKGQGGWICLAFLFDQKPKRDYDADLGFGASAIDNGYQLDLFNLEGVVRFKG
jgi:hypothetical protein